MHNSDALFNAAGIVQQSSGRRRPNADQISFVKILLFKKTVLNGIVFLFPQDSLQMELRSERLWIRIRFVSIGQTRTRSEKRGPLSL